MQTNTLNDDFIKALLDNADIGSLPEVTSKDNGKIAKVKDGAWAKGDDDGLPAVTADDNGKVLKVVDGDWAATLIE